MQKWFAHFSKWFANVTGHPLVFIVALLIILVWAISGPIFGFSDTWQLVINTSTTIITFLMVFLIQNTQNRDAAAIQLKLDELIRALGGAHNKMMDAEDRTMDELEDLRSKYLSEAQQADECADEAEKVEEEKPTRRRSTKKRRTQGSPRKSSPAAKKKIHKRAS